MFICFNKCWVDIRNALIKIVSCACALVMCKIRRKSILIVTPKLRTDLRSENRSVCVFRLFKFLAEQEEYKTKRTILYNGYDVFKNRLFEYFTVNKVEVEDNLIHLYLDASNINNIVVFENIDFSEYSEELHFILTNSIKNKNDFLGLPHKHLISIDFNEGIINLF